MAKTHCPMCGGRLRTTYKKGYIVDYAGYWRWCRTRQGANAWAIYLYHKYPAVSVADCAADGEQTRSEAKRNQ